MLERNSQNIPKIIINDETKERFSENYLNKKRRIEKTSEISDLRKNLVKTKKTLPEQIEEAKYILARIFITRFFLVLIILIWIIFAYNLAILKFCESPSDYLIKFDLTVIVTPLSTLMGFVLWHYFQSKND